MVSIPFGGPKSGTAVLLFGPQSLSYHEASLDRLRNTLLDAPGHRWILDTIAELPGYWETLTKKLPGLQAIQGAKQLQDLNSFFRTGRFTHVSYQLPNILLTPLGVLTQLSQYSRYLELALLKSGQRDDLHAAFTQLNAETLGLSTGLLSALAVSSSANHAQFQRNGAVAVRLAMLVGALVDAQDASDGLHGRSESFATAWNSSESGADMAQILNLFPEAYISVLYDEKRATVTTSKSTAPMLLHQLKAAGITASEVGLRGRFHCQCHLKDIHSVIDFCDSESAFQLPDASQLILRTHSNSSGDYIKHGKLHHVALRSILAEQSNWYQTFATVHSLRLDNKESQVISFGPDRCVPPSLTRKLGPQLVDVADLTQDTPELSVTGHPQPQNEELPKGLWTFAGYQDSKQRSARFRINTMSKKYEEFVSGYMIAQTAPVCPATLQVDMAIEALMSLHPDFAASNLQPQIQNVDNQSPICIDPSRLVWLDFEALHAESHAWSWKIVSNGPQNGLATTLHVTGKIVFRSADDPQFQLDFARHERFVEHHRCLRLLNSNDADDIIQGRIIYRTFADIVDYGEMYRGLHKLVGKDNESAGRVVKKYTRETWLDTHLSDCFSQVGGIWVNCMTDRAPTDMFIANGFEKWIRSPKLRNDDPRPDVWDVFAHHHHPPPDKGFVTDIYIFDSTNGALMEVILGINYVKVPKLSMSKILSGLTAGGTKQYQLAAAPPMAAKVEAPQAAAAPPPPSKPSEPAMTPKPTKEKKQSSRPDISSSVRVLLANIANLGPDDIKDDTELADIGIDIFMGMELACEIEGVFECSIPAERLITVTNFQSLVRCIQSSLGLVDDGATAGEDDDVEESEEDQQSSESQGTYTLSESSISTFSAAKVNTTEYIAELLGVAESDVALGTPLNDIGVDPLLSTKIRSDIADKLDVHISERLLIEELTVKELDIKINGPSGGNFKTASAPAPEKAVEEALQTNGVGTHADSATPTTTGVTGSSASGNLNILPSKILEAFGESKMLTDQFIADYGCADYLDTVMPKQTQLCVALIVETFEQLGCSLGTAKAGQKLDRIKYLPIHERLVENLYIILEKEARLVDVEGSHITRTAISLPAKSSNAILEDLMRSYPDHSHANKLIHFTGTRLADVLTGKSDGTKLIFETQEGRELVSGLYGDSLLNKASHKQMEYFIKQMVSKLPMHEGPLKILEMGAGTGGTTRGMAPLLASLNVPVEYTFTDPSQSSVAAARKELQAYPFMKFRVHDIEKLPADDLLNTQHIVIASNAVHATHSLTETTKNIRKALRPDGFLMMLEMTETTYWIDCVFGLLGSWWHFDDGRRHAIVHQSRWEKELQSVGYGHVDWSDGNRPEANIQRVIIALASGPTYDRLPTPAQQPPKNETTDLVAREAAVEDYVRKYTQGFAPPVLSGKVNSAGPRDLCVLVTGATGSLGSHLVAHFAELSNVKTVVCLNRRGSTDPECRQREALNSRGISLDMKAQSKLKVFGTHTYKPMLGLPAHEYESLIDTVTHIVHNAWPMSAKRPIKGFESQFRVLRNLVDLARDISCRRPQGSKVGFQFISSIATVGHYPLWSGNVRVPEERTTIQSALPSGYSDAKFTCERMLDETLHKYPERFRPMVARIGQISGSKFSGYWNPVEHVSFLVKSSQTLKALPDLDGVLSWCPVDDVAAALGDLLVSDTTPYPIYHVDNPVQQPWREMIAVLADALDVPHANIVPFAEWIARVRRSPLSVETDNPAGKLVEFFDEHFQRMACGGLILDTTKSREHSSTLAAEGSVSAEVVRSYVSAWREMGFLY